MRLAGSACAFACACWFVWVSGGLEWPGIRRRLDLVELDDGSGGLAGWVFVRGAAGGDFSVVVVFESVVSVSAGAAGGGSGCDVEMVAFGFDLAADANSAGNGVLLAAMPQAYSISPSCSWYPACASLPLCTTPLPRYLSSLKPCLATPA